MNSVKKVFCSVICLFLLASAARGISGASDPEILQYQETVVTEELTVGLPVFFLSGDPEGMSKKNTVEMEWRFRDQEGSCEVKWQGGSSLSYSKKNYTVKLDSAVDFGWGEHKKYVLKANYIDCTNALNLCGAKLWSSIVKDRGTHPAIKAGANNGAMDGFPVIVMLNDAFFGLYTLNTPKSGWSFGMEDAGEEYLVSAERHTPATQFREAAKLNGKDFKLEHAALEDETDETGAVKESLNKAISAIAGADGPDWEEAVDPYLDVDTAVDYMVFSALIGNNDGVDKNFLLSTYDGTKWYFNAYDMDTSFGNRWMGGQYTSPRSTGSDLPGMAKISRLFELIYTYSRPKLVERYDKLRSTVLSNENVSTVFYNFCGRIPQAVLEADNEKWPEKPGTYANTTARILDWYRMRLEFIDAEVNAIREKEKQGN